MTSSLHLIWFKLTIVDLAKLYEPIKKWKFALYLSNLDWQKWIIRTLVIWENGLTFYSHSIKKVSLIIIWFTHNKRSRFSLNLCSNWGNLALLDTKQSKVYPFADQKLTCWPPSINLILDKRNLIMLSNGKSQIQFHFVNYGKSCSFSIFFSNKYFWMFELNMR